MVGKVIIHTVWLVGWGRIGERWWGGSDTEREKRGGRGGKVSKENKWERETIREEDVEKKHESEVKK